MKILNEMMRKIIFTQRKLTIKLRIEDVQKKN